MLVQRKQIQPYHARFAGTLTPPALALLATQTVTVTLTPAVVGDVLAVGEQVTLHINPGGTLPNGMVMSYEPQVTAVNVISVKLAALVALAAQTGVAVTVIAHR